MTTGAIIYGDTKAVFKGYRQDRNTSDFPVAEVPRDGCHDMYKVSGKFEVVGNLR